MNGGDEDVPSPINFHDPEEVRLWIADTVRRRPYRPRYFAAFVAALNERFATPISVLELGSGPGHLAEQILKGCTFRRYVALDFSEAMHAVARERLAPFADRIEYLSRDFRDEKWGNGLGSFDAVVTQQAAHETRHKRHLAPFLKVAGSVIRPGGVILYCDHYAEEIPEKNNALYIAREDQPLALEDAGFDNVRLILEEGGMALYEGFKR